MAMLPKDIAWRSLEGDTWNRERWELLPHDDGRRWEVIDGVLHVSTSPSVFHQWIIRLIVWLLKEQIDDRLIGVTLWAPIGLFMAGCDPVQPDILVIRTEHRGIIHDRHIYGVPALIVEVLSPNNADYDLRIKRAAYAKAGVPEYWLVRPQTRDLFLLWQPDPALADFAQHTLIPPDGVLRSPTLPIEVPIASFFAGAPDTTL